MSKKYYMNKMMVMSQYNWNSQFSIIHICFRNPLWVKLIRQWAFSLKTYLRPKWAKLIRHKNAALIPSSTPVSYKIQRYTSCYLLRVCFPGKVIVSLLWNTRSDKMVTDISRKLCLSLKLGDSFLWRFVNVFY